MKVLVDDRREGLHGIARWSTEIRRRLPQELVPVRRTRIGPTSPVDPLFLAREVRRTDARVFFSPGSNAALVSPVPQLLVVHDLIHLSDPDETSLAKRAYYAAVTRRAVRSTGAVVTVSESSKQLIVAWSGLRPEQVTVAPGAAALTRCDHASPPSPEPYFLFVGNDRPHKRAALLLDAAARLPHRLVMVGSFGPEFVARAAGLGDRVEVRSGVSDDDLQCLYTHAVCTFMPSTVEGFGLPALESLACGTPVVFSSDAVAEIVAGRGLQLPEPATADDVVTAAGVMVAEGRTRWPVEDCLARNRDYDWDSSAAVVAAALQEFA